jgi:hypothetical protein
MSFDLKAELLAGLRARDAAKAESSTKEFRGGNSGIMLADGVVRANDPGSCLRTIFLRSKGIQAPLELKSYLTFALGLAFETVFEGLGHGGKVSLQSQIPVRGEIEGSTTPFRGTADFILTFKNGYRVVADTKSVSALRSFHDVFVKGKVKPGYIAQLVTYMQYLNIPHGFLAFGAFPYVPKDWLTAGKQRELGRKVEPDLAVVDVRIQEGSLLVNGQSWEFSLEDVERHRRAAALHIEHDTVERTRPLPFEGGFSPCYSCPFANTCTKWEAEGSGRTEKFLEYVKEELDGSRPQQVGGWGHD